MNNPNEVAGEHEARLAYLDDELKSLKERILEIGAGLRGLLNFYEELSRERVILEANRNNSASDENELYL